MKRVFFVLVSMLVLFSFVGCSGHVSEEEVYGLLEQSYTEVSDMLDQSGVADWVGQMGDLQTYDELVDDLVRAAGYISEDAVTGSLYINDELIISVDPVTTYKQVEELVSEFGLVIVDAMSDIGFYQLKLSEQCTLEQLEELVTELELEDLIEDAYVSMVSAVGEG